MRVYAVIHSVESLDEGYSETSVKFFDYPAGAWQEMQSIQESLSDWDDRNGESFDKDYSDGTVAVPKIEWGETRRYVYNDSPNQVVTFFSFWRPSGDWLLVYDQVNNKPSVSKTLDMVVDWIPARAEQEYYEDMMNNIRNGEPIMWDYDDGCLHWFPVKNIVLQDADLPF